MSDGSVSSELARARKDNLPANVFLSTVQCRWSGTLAGPHFLTGPKTYNTRTHLTVLHHHPARIWQQTYFIEIDGEIEIIASIYHSGITWKLKQLS